MVTTRIMVNGANTIVYPDGKTVIARDIYGLSTDVKPTKGISNGEVFLEMDTSKVYVIDETNATWHPL